MMRSILVAFLAVIAPALRNAPPVDPLVSAAWLNQHVHDADLVVLQTGPRNEYDKGHIAGARFPENGLESDATGSMDMTVLPAAAEIRGKLEKLGVSDRSHVVVIYVGNGAPSATRIIFLARQAGFENVSLLDGGMAAWNSAKLPVTKDLPTITPGRITAVAARDAGVDAAWVQGHLHAPHVWIIDARDSSYYSGPASAGMAMAAGHIPGAHNIPYRSLFSDVGLLLPAAALEAKFRATGVQAGDTVIAYCHVGFQATSVVFAARLIGQPAKMYVGSFHDWSAKKLPTEGGTP